ncbi:MAG TPA: hypothetical protein VFU60_09910 [Ktedonobacterales bacterium]|jgi:hypothetical protein|nr:hypothetical protein [Ktedonobacterales bacterium]
MPSQPARSTSAETTDAIQTTQSGPSTHSERDEREMPCPVCGAPMPDLKGGKATICPNCGFKDSCCY